MRLDWLDDPFAPTLTATVLRPRLRYAVVTPANDNRPHPVEWR